MFKNIHFGTAMDEYDNLGQTYLTLYDNDDIMSLLFKPELMLVLINELSYDMSKFRDIIVVMNDIYFGVILYPEEIVVYDYKPEIINKGVSESYELYKISYDGKIEFANCVYKEYIDKLVVEKVNQHEELVDFYRSLLPKKKRVN